MQQRLRVLAFGLYLITGTTAAFAQSNSNVEGAQEVQAAANAKGRLRIIATVVVADGPAATRRARLDEATARLVRASRGTGVSVADPIANTPLVVLEVDAQQLSNLLAGGQIEAVQEDVPVPPTLAQSTALIRATGSWAASAEGAGKAVAVLDTGVRSSHPFLAGKVTAEACFSSTVSFYGSTSVCSNGQNSQVGAGAGTNCSLSVEGCDHGTHVAGIAAGRGSSFSGVARAGSIVAVQVFSRFPASYCGGGSDCVLSFTSDQIRGLQHIIDTAATNKVAAVNMSLGGGSYTGPCDTDSRKSLIDSLASRKIATVVASGNNGFNNAVSAPGCISTAITVGASSDAAPEFVASFSNSSAVVDVLAPGVSITSSVPASSFAVFNGTSMATPHVAGAIALLQAAVPTATLDQIEQALELTGPVLRDTDSGIVKPRIDVLAALNRLRPSSGPGWQGWASVRSGVTAVPECIVSGSQQVDCWVNAAGSKVLWARRTVAGWTSWTDLGGSIATTVSCVQQSAKIHCFGIGTNAQLRQITYDGTRWGAWADRGGSFRLRPSCSAIGTTRLDCVTTGTNNKLWHTAFDASWRPPRQIGGAASTAPQCFVVGTGLDCFVVNASSAQTLVKYRGTAWGTFKSLGGTLATSPSCIYSGSTTVQCFAQGRDNTLRTSKTTGSTWSAWASIGSGIAAQPICRRFGGGERLVCLATNSGGAVLDFRYDGSSWQAAANIGGGIAGRGVAVFQGTTRLDFFARGTDSSLRFNSYF